MESHEQCHCTHRDQGKSMDPVCGMEVTIRDSTPTFKHQDHSYYFCAQHCKLRFAENPQSFLEPSSVNSHRTHPQGLIGAQYSCPMHPDVTGSGPGSCPECGMALTPVLPQKNAGPHPELVDFRRRLIVTIILTLPVMWLSMGGMLGSEFNAGLPAQPWRNWLQLVFALPVCTWAAWPFYDRAWGSIRRARLNMFTLIGTGVAIAFGYSVVATLFPDLFPQEFRHPDGNLHVYFEAACMITALVFVGQILEILARDRAGKSIEQLASLVAKTAHHINEQGELVEIDPQDIQVGMLLRVKPAELIPTDGTITEGHSSVNEAMISGEPIPNEKTIGDAVIGGSTNGAGAFTMQATKVGRDTLLRKIIEIVAQAQRSQAPIQRVADKAAAVFVPTVIIVAAITFGSWLLWGPEPRPAYALVNAIAVLIIACPCALGLATPMSIMVASGRGAKQGVLFRNAESLERLSTITHVFLDKTGTITAGKPTLQRFIVAPGRSEELTLKFAASLESHSEHPLADAIVEYSKSKSVLIDSVERVEVTPGGGIAGYVDNQYVLVGKARWLQQNGVDLQPLRHSLQEVNQHSRSIVCVAVDGQAAGIFLFADPIKESSVVAIAELQKLGIRVTMLTGDNETTAQQIAASVGIKEIFANISPTEKAEKVKEAVAAGQVVAMVGDGINDAPALAYAHIGVAMGSGTEAAMQSSDITLVRGDLSQLVSAYRLSKKTLRNIRQNLFFAFGYNSLGIPIAAGLFYPLTGWLLSPVIAAAAMSLSSVSVIANALRLR